jgi:hypothetical protein
MGNPQFIEVWERLQLSEHRAAAQYEGQIGIAV